MHHETYRGIPIAIATALRDGKWTSNAVYTGEGHNEARIEPPEKGYATEDEAHQAALQAAVESIDRGRSFIGKP